MWAILSQRYANQAGRDAEDPAFWFVGDHLDFKMITPERGNIDQSGMMPVKSINSEVDPMASLILSALAYPIIQTRFLKPDVIKTGAERDLVQIQVSATVVGELQTAPEIAKFTLSLLAAPISQITGVKIEFDFVEEGGVLRDPRFPSGE